MAKRFTLRLRAEKGLNEKSTRRRKPKRIIGRMVIENGTAKSK